MTSIKEKVFDKWEFEGGQIMLYDENGKVIEKIYVVDLIAMWYTFIKEVKKEGE